MNSTIARLVQLVVDHSTQARQNLKILRLVEVLALFDLRGMSPPLLLCLSSFYPVLHV
jgi:hypothetical protein